MDDENMKNAKRAADMVMLQNKARDFQDKMTALSNKEYQGRYQGIEIKMKGDSMSTLIKVFTRLVEKVKLKKHFSP